MRRPLNIFLFVVLVAVLVLNWLIRQKPTERNQEIMTEMRDSLAYESQAEYTAVKGGNTSLRPVAGTIARGFAPLHYGTAPEEAKRAGAELGNPFVGADPKRVDRGAVVYGNFCAVCHGSSGMGNGTVTTRGFPPPPSLFAENATDMADGQMFHIITYGQRNMPGYAAQVAREDRWNAILYIRSLQKKQKEAASPPSAVQPPASASKVSQEVRP